MVENIMTAEMNEYVERATDVEQLISKQYLAAGNSVELTQIKVLFFRALCDLNVIVELLIANDIFTREYYLKWKSEFYENYLNQFNEEASLAKTGD